MEPANKERRSRHRCAKDVAMHCSFLHGDANRQVMLRNYSNRGLYFESSGEIRSETLVILRAMDAHDLMIVDQASDMPQFSINRDDPEACMDYRSHTLAKVQRCVKLKDSAETPRYLIAAEIQILTD
jgi:hypothetical protein